MILVLMGVSGSGKTEIGQRLAAELGWPFFDGDQYQPVENIQKMSQGIPLKDEDRWPWLAILRGLILDQLNKGGSAVVACSALKQAYRKRLRSKQEPVYFVYLKGQFNLIRERLETRQGHFMKSGLLESQFSTLEEPENAFVVDIDQPPERIVAAIKSKFEL